MLWVPQTIKEKAWVLDVFGSAGVMLRFSVDLSFICNVVDNIMTAAVAYDGFNGKTCAMHQIVSKNGANPRFLWAAFDYPFNQCGCVEVVGIVAANNEPALKLDKHLGFKEVYRVQGGWDGTVDMVIMTMRRDECRWLKLTKRFRNEIQNSRVAASGGSIFVPSRSLLPS